MKEVMEEAFAYVWFIGTLGLAVFGIWLFGHFLFGIMDWPWYLWWIPGILSYQFGALSGGSVGLALGGFFRTLYNASRK